MPAYGFGPEQKFSFSQIVAVGTADYTLVAAPGTGKTLVVQAMTIAMTVAAAATCTIGSTNTALFAIPASLPVGTYGWDCGVIGKKLTLEEALLWDASAAGIGATISGFGYIVSG